MSERIVVLGAPGAGKGTQAAKLAVHLGGIPTISTGALFRKHMSEGTELGELAQSYIDEGNLVPNDVTTQMLAERLRLSDTAKGFILDGYPRNVDQAQTLEGLLVNQQVTAVIEFMVDADEVVSRLLHRAEIEGRSDDTEEVIRRRLEVYREQTAPLVAYYSERGLLVEVDAMGSVDEVTARMIAALENR